MNTTRNGIVTVVTTNVKATEIGGTIVTGNTNQRDILNSLFVDTLASNLRPRMDTEWMVTM